MNIPEQALPRITWLMPVKNGMPYLPATLHSLASQTYRHFTVLVWENGSTDGTIEELNRWIPEQLPGRVIVGQPKNLGGSLAALVEAAETELCARIDADDICSPGRLEQQVSFMLSHPEVALVGAQVRAIDTDGLPREGTLPCPLDHDDIVHSLITINLIPHPSVLFRRSAILAAGNYAPDAVFEDYDLWLRLAQRHKLVTLPATLVDYRIHHASYSRRIEQRQETETLLTSTFQKNAPKLFGLEKEEAGRLRSHRSFCAIAGAVKMARYLAKTQGGSTWTRLRSPTLIHSLYHLTSNRDVLSRFCFSALVRRKGSLRTESRIVLKQILNKISEFSGAFERLLHWKV